MLKLRESFNLQTVTGLLIFLVVLAALTVLMSLMMLPPRETAYDLRKTGDFIEGLRAEGETAKWLRKTVLFLAIPSSLVLCIMAGLPLLADLLLQSPGGFYSLTVSLMIAVSIIFRVVKEYRADKVLESYRPFLP